MTRLLQLQWIQGLGKIMELDVKVIKYFHLKIFFVFQMMYHNAIAKGTLPTIPSTIAPPRRHCFPPPVETKQTPSTIYISFHHPFACCTRHPQMKKYGVRVLLSSDDCDCVLHLYSMMIPRRRRTMLLLLLLLQLLL